VEGKRGVDVRLGPEPARPGHLRGRVRLLVRMPPRGQAPGDPQEVEGQAERGDEEETLVRLRRRGYFSPPRISRRRRGRALDFSRTSRSICWRSAPTLRRRVASSRARMAAARWPAFLAPIEPTPTVATGMPGGICTVDSSASNPPRGELATGTPITGRVECAAVTPAR